MPGIFTERLEFTLINQQVKKFECVSRITGILLKEV